MSYTTTYRLFKTKVVEISEHNNGYGSAPIVWQYLEHHYLPATPYSRMVTGKMKKIWDLHSDCRLRKSEWLALNLTYDWAYCPTTSLIAAADLLDEFAILSELANQANHWHAIAADYRTAAIKPDHRMLGVCINHTSIYNIWEYRSEWKTPWPINLDEYIGVSQC